MRTPWRGIVQIFDACGLNSHCNRYLPGGAFTPGRPLRRAGSFRRVARMVVHASGNHRHRRDFGETRAGLRENRISADRLHRYQRGSRAEVRRASRRGIRPAPTRKFAAIPQVDYVDVCTFPDFRLQPIEICAQTGKHVQVQKPMSTNLETARRMIETARRGGILLGVVSQHRFDDASLFLSKAIAAGRLGKLLQCDCYVKWYRSREVLFTAHQGKLADRRRRRAHQPGDSPGRYPALAGRAGEGAIRRVAAWRAAQDRIRRRGERGDAVRQRRDGRDPGRHGILAGLYGAHRIPRHQGHRHHLRRQADHLGRRRTIRANRRR